MEVWLLYSFVFFIAPFACGFNLDTENPRIFPSPQDGSAFGHRVCPFGSKPGGSCACDGTPLYSKGTGGVFRCFLWRWRV
ncbi:hypothetical protein MHYP_G00285040 [Metynnis hypsauchen]